MHYDIFLMELRAITSDSPLFILATFFWTPDLVYYDLLFEVSIESLICELRCKKIHILRNMSTVFSKCYSGFELLRHNLHIQDNIVENERNVTSITAFNNIILYILSCRWCVILYLFLQKWKKRNHATYTHVCTVIQKICNVSVIFSRKVDS